jgi:tetratricopeptide (TPR) repeat protein
MEYDRLGFPIPPRFEPARDDTEGFGLPPAPRGRPDPARLDPARPDGADRRRAGRGKRTALFALLGLVIVPALVAPVVLPAIRDAVVDWSLEEAARCEAVGDGGGALAHVDRAVRWAGDDPRLICLRGQLRIGNGDAAGAAADADLAADLQPAAPQPRRLRALANTMLGRADAALADAEAVVDLSVDGDPESLNLRAYTRALLGRDLERALDDIERALDRPEDPLPEHLDTRGYVLHLLGRNAEAIDDLNRAIDGMQDARYRVTLLAGRIDRAELGRRLRVIDQSLAVMHQHRAMACQAAGFGGQAEQDFEVARRKGFDPSRGVF